MPQLRIPCAYVRGGTSRGLFFLRDDLPADPAQWDAIFLRALGSPDPNGRQLDGMGGGISSLSKVVVVERSQRDDAEIDYTFAQVAVDAARVEYGNNCGNLTSAVGPFALSRGLVRADGQETTLRLFNRNTSRRIIASIPLDDGEAAVEGELELPGVAGRGAAIRLAFEDPGGAVTGRLLPSGATREALQVPGIGAVEASIVDAATATVFVAAGSLGLTGAESPADLESPELAVRIEAVRRSAAEAMRQGPEAIPNRPFIALLAAAAPSVTLEGRELAAGEVDLLARAWSMGRPHRALPLTVGLCLAAAARIEGTLVADLAGPARGPDLRVGTPSGVLEANAEVRRVDEGWVVDQIVASRTARILMEGQVLIPASTMAEAGG